MVAKVFAELFPPSRNFSLQTIFLSVLRPSFSFYHLVLLLPERRSEMRRRQEISAQNYSRVGRGRERGKVLCHSHVAHTVAIFQSCRHDYKLLLFKRNSIFSTSILLNVNFCGEKRREKTPSRWNKNGKIKFSAKSYY